MTLIFNTVLLMSIFIFLHDVFFSVHNFFIWQCYTKTWKKNITWLLYDLSNFFNIKNLVFYSAKKHKITIKNLKHKKYIIQAWNIYLTFGTVFSHLLFIYYIEKKGKMIIYIVLKEIIPWLYCTLFIYLHLQYKKIKLFLQSWYNHRECLWL